MAPSALTPLKGIRVLDLTNVLAGPFCCHQLAHLGAEVIKVEMPKGGDLARQLGADPELSAKGMGVSFLAQNAGKKSVTANLKTERGREVLRRLVQSADVLVENYRPGVMDRLGVGYEVLRRENPELIYCAISGFGQTGPWTHRPAYDQIVQGASGVMAITGDAESAPLRVGYPVADSVGGLTAALAISAALNSSNRGAFIDVSMLESLIATMGWAVSNWMIAGQKPTANGNENLTSAPSGTFRAKDAPLNIAANKDEQWEILARHIGREDLIAHTDYLTREDRKRNRLALRSEIEKALAAKSAEDWAEELNALGVPAGAVLDLTEVLDHEVIRSRGMIADFEEVEGVGRSISVLRTGIKINGEVPKVDSPPPRLGADSDEILLSLGYSAQDIGEMRERGEI
ncbi:CoA transferase [Marivivens sp. LCG002]|uniref:CaiB/BaiF CoA transferase family protein n=1 Tax=Marivivens sp. LCG002 TaxID=3051171 RepID=UPI002552C34A|nr:CoA transferase [Marivivens sp. LCG002]WIV51599.1 CoA transferase [Marivivens sp. LCG002]